MTEPSQIIAFVKDHMSDDKTPVRYMLLRLNRPTEDDASVDSDQVANEFYTRCIQTHPEVSERFNEYLAGEVAEIIEEVKETEEKAIVSAYSPYVEEVIVINTDPAYEPLQDEVKIEQLPESKLTVQEVLIQLREHQAAASAGFQKLVDEDESEEEDADDSAIDSLKDAVLELSMDWDKKKTRVYNVTNEKLRTAAEALGLSECLA